MSRILVTGGAGQIGLELARIGWPKGVEVVLPNRASLDLGERESVAKIFERHSWDVVVNCAAYTAVDAAEDDVGNAFLYNSQGPAWLAEAAHEAGANFIQVSTDYVFDGASGDPYLEDCPVSPLGAYGASKLAGELAVRVSHPKAVILRTAWVLSAHRSNFLKTMLRLGADRSSLSVVDDQRGCPTSAGDIAQTIRTIALRQLEDPHAPFGIHHFVNAGEASWYELACKIFDLAGKYGVTSPNVEAISSLEYPTRARRPTNSRLDCRLITKNFGIVPRPWEDAVADIVNELCVREGRRFADTIEVQEKEI